MGRADPGHIEPVAGQAATVPAQRTPVQDEPGFVPGGVQPVQDEPGPAAKVTGPSRTGQPVRDDAPEVAALLPAAQTAAATLATQGTPLSRTALAAQLRAEGHSLSNATASALVRLLRTEPPQAATGPEA